MEPEEIHSRLVRTLADREAVTFDEIVLVPETRNAEAGEMLDWLAWARRTGHIEDAGKDDGRKLYRLLPLGAGARNPQDHGLGSEDVRRSRHGR